MGDLQNQKSIALKIHPGVGLDTLPTSLAESTAHNALFLPVPKHQCSLSVLLTQPHSQHPILPIPASSANRCSHEIAL